MISSVGAADWLLVPVVSSLWKRHLNNRWRIFRNDVLKLGHLGAEWTTILLLFFSFFLASIHLRDGT